MQLLCIDSNLKNMSEGEFNSKKYLPFKNNNYISDTCSIDLFVSTEKVPLYWDW